MMMLFLRAASFFQPAQARLCGGAGVAFSRQPTLSNTLTRASLAP